jgi:hypothetical protein
LRANANRQGHRAVAFGQVFGMQRPGLLDLTLQMRLQAEWQHGFAVFAAFAVAHGDFIALEIQVFHAQTHGFHQA